jgi:molecular chaperone GrpE (heat shock protein)
MWHDNLSKLAKDVIEAEGMEIAALETEKELLQLMTKIFRQHFTELLALLEAYSVDESASNRHEIDRRLDTMYGDCEAFREIGEESEHPQLAELTEKLQVILREMQGVLEGEGVEEIESSSDYRKWLKHHKNALVRYYRLLGTDLRGIIREDERLLSIIQEMHTTT